MTRTTTVHPSLPPLRLVNRRTQEHAGACPFCGGDHRSDRFHVWLEEDKQRYWCRNCNEKGPLHKLLGDDPRPVHVVPPRRRGRAAPPAAQVAHIPHYRQLYTVVALWAAGNLHEAHNPEPLAYVRGRGLSDAAIHHALLGVSRQDPLALAHYLQTEFAELLPYAEAAGVLVREDDGTWRTHPNLCGSIVLPYLADGTIVDLRTRRYGGKGYRSLSGGYGERGAVFPFGWDALGDATTVIVTEGEFKALAVTAAYGAGHLAMPAIAHPGLSYFRDAWPTLLRDRGVTTVVLAYDSQPRAHKDGVLQLAPEETWTIRHGLLLAHAGLQVKVLRLPLTGGATKADLDDYLLQHGAPALQRLLDTAPLLLDYHRSLPCTLLRQAQLPLPGGHPRRRARPVPLASVPEPPPAPPPTTLAATRTAIPRLVGEHAAHGAGFLVLAHPPGTGKGYGTTAGLKAYLQATAAGDQIIWSALRKAQLGDQQGLYQTDLHNRHGSAILLASYLSP